MHEVEILKGVRESIDRLEGQRKIVYGSYAAALIGGLRYLSSEDYHRAYKKLGPKVLVAPHGSTEVEGSVDADFLPTDIETASDVYLRMAEEAVEKISWLGPSRATPHRRERQFEMTRLYTAGTAAVGIVEDGRVGLTLEGRGARCLAVDPEDPEVVYVGTSDNGLFKSSDGGRSWERLSGISHPRLTAVAISPADDALYAGTEPSSLFVSRDGGGTWRELEGMKNLPSAPTWSFPPRPWTSHVRAIAPSYSDPNLVIAGIELGGVVRSPDGGESWQDQRPGAYPDCHALTAHAATPETLYEAAGGGFAESTDSGESWASADDGITRRYVWGLAVDLEDPTLLYVSAAPGPGRAHGSGFSDAAIYRRREGGRWEPVAEGLSEFPYALAPDPEVPGTVYAGLGDGTILRSTDAGGSWEEVARVPGLDALAAVAA